MGTGGVYFVMNVFPLCMRAEGWVLVPETPPVKRARNDGRQAERAAWVNRGAAA